MATEDYAHSEGNDDVEDEEIMPLLRIKVSKDLKYAMSQLSMDSVRFLVDMYYTIQEDRKRTGNKIRARVDASSEDPNYFLHLIFKAMGDIEHIIRYSMGVVSLKNDPGVWCLSIKGIGPVLTAGLISNFDITKAPTVGHFWSFAGLDPEKKWNKGEKRPWNAKLKSLCWLAGESFVKVSAREDDIYGKIWRARKDLEIQRNEAGLLKDQAEKTLLEKRIGKDTEAYKWYAKGMLPPARIHLRAERYAVKLFLAHLHHVMYENHYHTLPPKPYILDKQPYIHTHYIAPPNWPLTPELRQMAQKKA